MLCSKSDSALPVSLGFGLIGLQIIAMVYMTAKVRAKRSCLLPGDDEQDSIPHSRAESYFSDLAGFYIHDDPRGTFCRRNIFPDRLDQLEQPRTERNREGLLPGLLQSTLYDLPHYLLFCVHF